MREDRVGVGSVSGSRACEFECERVAKTLVKLTLALTFPTLHSHSRLHLIFFASRIPHPASLPQQCVPPKHSRDLIMRQPVHPNIVRPSHRPPSDERVDDRLL